MIYGPKDIQSLDDPIKIIRRRPDLYGGEVPRGRRFAAALTQDLIQHGDLPVRTELLQGWWLVVCGVDWLTRERTAGKDYWRRIVPIPPVNAIRSEVVLAALCQGLFTATRDSLEWIRHEEDSPEILKRNVDAILTEGFHGRVVGFVCD